MSGIYDYSNRQVIPRWYPFSTACGVGDLEPVMMRDVPKCQSPEAYQAKVQDWREKRTIPRAVDLVGTAIIIGDLANIDARNAADYILSSHTDIPSLTREIAELFVAGNQLSAIPTVYLSTEVVRYRHEVARMKNLVRRYPRNAIAWADLAFYYTLLGQKHKAEQCISLALSIAGENRFLLRSAARFFLHIDEPDKSLFYLRRSGLSGQDPWIVSAEIAISEGTEQKPRLVKPAKSMITNSNFSPWSLNELAATLSTLEAQHGSVRKSRKLLSMALRQPNENTIAQAEWLASASRLEVVRPQTEIIAPFEADTWLHFRNQDYTRAFQCSKEWFGFQPFTSRPVVMASYIASVCLQDHHEAITVIENAKAASPDSFMLSNNYAFALASLDRIEVAEKVLSDVHEADLSHKERYTLLATRALIDFRKGRINEGRGMYNKAILGFKTIGDFHAAAIAATFRAREETLVHSEFEKDALLEATNLANKHDVKELFPYLRSLESKS